MGTQFRPRKGHEQVVARRVQAITEQVADVAMDNAPPTKTWRSSGDDEAGPSAATPTGGRCRRTCGPDYYRAHYGRLGGSSCATPATETRRRA
ncbi:hypothetical protein [Micromonospora sp. NBC_00858]|uniref:hypothetical protein n=1 Tax=Micromonospora sp. NBC_00858 TaxID=2975979 RepID=UPI00386C1BD9|nr:hypothetical protein OG990_04915 [Micromonospora sp. NBC_00858]